MRCLFLEGTDKASYPELSQPTMQGLERGEEQGYGGLAKRQVWQGAALGAADIQAGQQHVCSLLLDRGPALKHPHFPFYYWHLFAIGKAVVRCRFQVRTPSLVGTWPLTAIHTPSCREAACLGTYGTRGSEPSLALGLCTLL